MPTRRGFASWPSLGDGSLERPRSFKRFERVLFFFCLRLSGRFSLILLVIL